MSAPQVPRGGAARGTSIGPTAPAPQTFGARARAHAGFSMVELMTALVLAGILLGLAFTSWKAYTAGQQLRFGAAQVASDLREAEERAKAERIVYTVTFTGTSAAYTIARSGGGFLEHATLPGGVTPVSSDVVTFSPFGQPDATHTITLQGVTGTRTASVDSRGGISYQGP